MDEPVDLNLLKNVLTGKRGGARPGAGAPKGTIQKRTIDKALYREVHRQEIAKHAPQMIRSQVMHAIGIHHLFTRDKTGKFTRVEDEQKTFDLLEHGTEGQDFFIFQKDPSVAAFTDLMNRAFDKPKEQEQELKVDGVLEIRIAKPW